MHAPGADVNLQLVERNANEKLATLNSSDIIGWESVEFGHIACGPGILFLNDSSITVVDERINSETLAREKVNTFNAVNPSNPIIMWQLGNPYSDGKKEGGGEAASTFYDRDDSSDYEKGPMEQHHFVALTKKFLQQSHVSPREPKAYALSISEFQPDRKWGSDLYYATY